jgi:hypothetical protein
MPSSFQLGVPTTVLQNQVMALPARACWVLSSVALEFALAEAGPWVASAASTTGVQTGASHARCPTAGATVSCKAL